MTNRFDKPRWLVILIGCAVLSASFGLLYGCQSQPGAVTTGSNVEPCPWADAYYADAEHPRVIPDPARKPRHGAFKEPR